MKRRVSFFVLVGVLALVGPAAAQSPFGGPSTTADVVFDEQLTANIATALTFFSNNYWTGSGNQTTGIRFAQYDSAGNLIATFSPGIDFRSLTIFGGTIQARGFASNILQPMTSPGVFAGTGI